MGRKTEVASDLEDVELRTVEGNLAVAVLDLTHDLFRRGDLVLEGLAVVDGATEASGDGDLAPPDLELAADGLTEGLGLPLGDDGASPEGLALGVNHVPLPGRVLPS